MGHPRKVKDQHRRKFHTGRAFHWQDNFAAGFETIRHFTNQFYKLNQNLFCERIQQHRILDCHGDLHLDHIHLTPEATTIFDCIEFNDRFRFIDIANDIAFLAMDFDFEGRSDLGNLLLRNAACELRDAGMLKVANFYKCYRAFVRGKVETIQATEKETTNPTGTRETSGSLFSSRASVCHRRLRAVDSCRDGSGRHGQEHYRETTCRRVGLAGLFLRRNSQDTRRRSAHSTIPARVA